MEKLVGGFEERVLLAVRQLQDVDEAYGLKIRAILNAATRVDTALGAVYTTLYRLEGKGFVESRNSEPRPERGGRSRRLFRLTASGEGARLDAQRSRSSLALGWNTGSA
jgi:DNA-binding PadR family transcriptional regulator